MFYLHQWNLMMAYHKFSNFLHYDLLAITLMIVNHAFEVHLHVTETVKIHQWGLWPGDMWRKIDTLRTSFYRYTKLWDISSFITWFITCYCLHGTYGTEKRLFSYHMEKGVVIEFKLHRWLIFRLIILTQLIVKSS